MRACYDYTAKSGEQRRKGNLEMNYLVYYLSRWLKEVQYCGEFPTMELANEHVTYLQNNFANGKKLTFKITKVVM